MARFVVDGLLIELVPTADPAALAGAGNARLCLAVPGIEATVERLRARGVAVSEAQAVANGQLALLKDPDGNEIVLWQDAERQDGGTPGADRTT